MSNPVKVAPSDLTSSWRAWPVGYGTRLSAGQWTPAPHHELIASEMMATIFGKESRRLIVTAPPRHGKSEAIGHWGSVWYLDWFPTMRVVLAMYAADLAGETGAKVRDTIRENPDDLDIRIKRDSSARNRWNTTKGGGFIAAGVGGIITGRGGGLLLIDDPIKNAEEASSQLMRQKHKDWYQSTLRTRLEPGPDGGDGTIILVLTRWHADDLAGWLLKEQGDIWRELRLPAIAEEDDALGRQIGEPLWPGRYPLEALERTRDELGPYVFNGMYQQRPTAPKGTILQRDWWRRYANFPRERVEQWLGSIDCTFADTDGSDFVVIQVWARVGAEKYLLDSWRQRADFVTTCDATVAMARRWPEVNEWVVENKANGPAVLSQLRQKISGLVPFNPADSKLARATACAPTARAGQVFLPTTNVFAPLLPTDRESATVADFIDECAAFDKGIHDDQVDAYTQAMLHMGVSSPLLASRTWSDDRLKGRR